MTRLMTALSFRQAARSVSSLDRPRFVSS